MILVERWGITRIVVAISKGSRAGLAQELSLADVFGIVANNPDLPSRRRQDMLSALRTAGRILAATWSSGVNFGDPLSRIPADPRLLAQQYRGVAPLVLPISPARWANVRSLVHAAVGTAVRVAPARHRNPLLPGWQRALDQLPEPMRRPLSRFAHFCRRLASSRTPSRRAHLRTFASTLGSVDCRGRTKCSA